MANRSRARTKKAIKRAFSELTGKYGLENVTVSQISRAAGVNRGTFYLHYKDKDDLRQQLEDEAVAAINHEIFSHNDQRCDDPVEVIPFEAISAACAYIKDDFDFFQAMISPCGDHSFMARLRDTLAVMIEEKILQSDTLHFQLKGFPRDYAMQIMLAGIVAIIELWLSKGGEESPEEIARIVHESRLVAPYEFLK